MGRIIPLPSDEHRDLQALLPWYVGGQLDDLERARIDAHLGACPDCLAEARFQRELAAEIKRLPMDAEAGWSRMRERLAADRPAWRRRLAALWRAATRPNAGSGLGATGSGWASGAGPNPGSGLTAAWPGWAVAAGLAVVCIVLALPGARPAPYHVLGARPRGEAGNVLVMFRPDTSERDIRQALDDNQARLVDGPTAAGAYVLRLPDAARTAALARLRARAGITLAEPIDSAAPPR